ncbi:MAG: DDE-type integrase/transposase/recombinase, partial [Solirubrobacterales bacterium]|nr:DDE-type integrase/transposase/recombinase [Solirubrobacterales bacterium]
YLREVRPMFLKLRTHQRTVYRPGEICQWDLWEPSALVPVGHGQVRRAWVVVCCLGYSRAGAGALIFSKEAPDVLWGMGRCLWQLGALPELMVWDREGCLHAGGGRPTDSYAAFCGRLPVGWHFCEPADPQAKGAVERLQGYLETNFEPGRRFANHLDYQLQLDAWFAKVNARTHKTLRARPIDRLLEEREVMRVLPEREPDLDRRWVLRVAPDPHVRFDTNDYSLDPNLVGRRVEVRVSQREIIAVALDTGELACRHERVFAKNRTITALEHARTLRDRRGQPGVEELVVEQRPLSVYDQLIA